MKKLSLDTFGRLPSGKRRSALGRVVVIVVVFLGVSQHNLVEVAVEEDAEGAAGDDT